jgi:uncharacterized membrane protein YkvA (DUF1232 family)
VKITKVEVWKQKARQLRTETYALYLASRDPRVPWYAKLSAICVAAYALSPIDLIPDFIPVLGYLDDLVLIPLGIAITVKMIPPPVLAECRVRAQTRMAEVKPIGLIGATFIIGTWLLLAILTIPLAVRFFNSLTAIGEH